MNGDLPAPGLTATIEAILFVAEEPVELAELARVLDLSQAATRAQVERLAQELRQRGLRLQQQAGRVQMVTAPETAAAVARFQGGRQERRLSTAALETLAIIAYRQPVTRPEVEAIRGVDCGRAIATLRALGLIDEVGRAESPGRPLLYGTTLRFLEHFGLEHPSDLPPIQPATHSGVH